jgi:prophage regulatory protein
MLDLQLLRQPAVRSLYPLGRSQFYSNIKQGLFVKPVRLGTRASAWPRREVEQICAAIISGKGDAELRVLVKSLEAARKVAA